MREFMICCGDKSFGSFYHIVVWLQLVRLLRSGGEGQPPPAWTSNKELGGQVVILKESMPGDWEKKGN